MRLLTNVFTLALFLLMSTQAYALPKAFSAKYNVTKSGLSLGTMQSSLSYQGNQYHYHKKTVAKGLAAILSGDVLIENSDGIVRSELFVAKNYLRHHKSKRKDKKDNFRFNSPTSVQGSYEGKAYHVTVPNGTTDLTSLELQLMQSFATGKQQASYHIVDRGKLKNYTFKKLGTENINLNAGSYLCEKVQVARKNGNRKTTLWLAKELDYFPVRIQHNDNGDILEAKMTSYKAR